MKTRVGLKYPVNDCAPASQEPHRAVGPDFPVRRLPLPLPVIESALGKDYCHKFSSCEKYVPSELKPRTTAKNIESR